MYGMLMSQQIEFKKFLSGVFFRNCGYILETFQNNAGKKQHLFRQNFFPPCDSNSTFELVEMSLFFSQSNFEHISAGVEPIYLAWVTKLAYWQQLLRKKVCRKRPEKNLENVTNRFFYERNFLQPVW